MRILDDAYRQYTSGRMEQTDWDVYERVIDLAAGPSGFSAYFLQRESLHTTQFVSFIGAKLSAAEKKTESFYK